MNGVYPRDFMEQVANDPALEEIVLAVAYVSQMDEVFRLAAAKGCPLTLYALADGEGFPAIPIVERFTSGSRTDWQLFLTRDFYHPKILWFRGVGAYIGSANLTDRAWWSNLECGLWIPQQDLVAQGWDAQLRAMLLSIRVRCVAATKDHLTAFERLGRDRARLREEQRKYASLLKDRLEGIPGGEEPPRPTGRGGVGGSARAAFIAEWDSARAILAKLIDGMRRDGVPSWVNAGVHLAFVQDQATEYWYHHSIRVSGNSAGRIRELREQNRGNPARALDAAIALWANHDPGPSDTLYVNQVPMRLHALLTKENLRQRRREDLVEIVRGCHASRDHSRQVRKSEFGLPAGTQNSLEECCELLADYLIAHPSAENLSVWEVLEYVLWGDTETPHAGARIWDAANLPRWRIRHLADSTLGELFGYARPDVSPPRNDRVRSTLAALGFAGHEP